MSDDPTSRADGESAGVKVNAGDSLYIPAGGLQLWTKKDGTLGVGVSVAVDPWLPDLSTDRGTALEVVESISRNGFPISTICHRGTIHACQKTQEVAALIRHQEVQRLKHMVVLDGERAVGILDLDKARGRFKHGDAESELTVESVYEEGGEANSMRSDAPLMDYLLTADRQPFRLIELEDGTLATVDVEDLQKMPVRALLLMWFAYLETLLSRRLSEEVPELREIRQPDTPVEADGLGRFGGGPVRRVERLYFQQLLEQASHKQLISLKEDEIQFLHRYRNSIFHGPRWYVTRRGEVGSLVNCFTKVVSLARALACVEGRE